MTSNPADDAQDGHHSQPSAKRKREPSTTLHSYVLRSPQWVYFHLRAISTQSNLTDLDPIEVRKTLLVLLATFLGDHGAAISLDILKIAGTHVILRAHWEDRKAVMAGVGGAVPVATASRIEGFRLIDHAPWLASINDTAKQDQLFTMHE